MLGRVTVRRGEVRVVAVLNDAGEWECDDEALRQVLNGSFDPWRWPYDSPAARTGSFTGSVGDNGKDRCGQRAYSTPPAGNRPAEYVYRLIGLWNRKTGLPRDAC